MSALPTLIEYLLSIERPNSSGPLVQQGASQTIVTLPPGQTVTLEAFPFGDDYADIVYRSAIDITMLPNVFYGWGANYGNRTTEGVLTAWWTNNAIDSFVVVSGSQPARALVMNQTNLNQYYIGTAFFLSIRNAEDYQYVKEACVNASHMQSLQVESVRLLKKLVEGGR